MCKLRMRRLRKVGRGGVSPWLNEVESEVCSVIHSDILGNSINKDMHYERTGQVGVGKYLRESYYHRIECSVANSLAALLRK